MEAHDFKAWRQNVGLTQADAAEKLGVTRSTIQNWENAVTPISPIVEQGCRIWGERLRQIRPDIGPVTLIYSDGPMFINPYGPRRPLAMMKQEPYPTNAAAIARVIELWRSDRDHFHNPFIIEESRNVLWNAVQLERVVNGSDSDAPVWRRVTIAKATREELVAELNVKALINACTKAYGIKGLPRDVLIFRDRQVDDDYVFYLSPAAFALTEEIRKIVDSVAFCDEPNPSSLKKIEL